ncbi:MAG: hypothetical protein AB1625_02355 [Acidobacteriota bacterium]
MSGCSPPSEGRLMVERIERGERPVEGEVVRVLRQPSCPGHLVERLAACDWIHQMRRSLPLLVRHPACPRPFAWEVLPRLGWRDLLDIVRHPRTAPPVRRQAEKKLLDKFSTMTMGERTTLARMATRSVISAILEVDEPRTIEALLENPQCTETEAVRVLLADRSAACVMAVVRHPRWCSRPAVTRAALRASRVPLGIALGLVATLPTRELSGLAQAPDVGERIRHAAANLREERSGERRADRDLAVRRASR